VVRDTHRHRRSQTRRGSPGVLSRDLQESEAKLEEAQRITHVRLLGRDVITNGVTWSTKPTGSTDCGLRMSYGLGNGTKRFTPKIGKLSLGHRKRLSGVVPVTTAEFRVFRPTGEVRIVHSQGCEKDTFWQPIKCSVTVQDITDRQARRGSRSVRQAYLVEAQSLTHTGSVH